MVIRFGDLLSLQRNWAFMGQQVLWTGIPVLETAFASTFVPCHCMTGLTRPGILFLNENLTLRGNKIAFNVWRAKCSVQHKQ
jgi:hypothetical protein